MLEIFKKQKYIYTEYDEKHIRRLNKEKIPFEIREEIPFFEMFKKGYIRYSAIAEIVVIGGVLWAIFFKWNL